MKIVNHKISIPSFCTMHPSKFQILVTSQCTVEHIFHVFFTNHLQHIIFTTTFSFVKK